MSNLLQSNDMMSSENEPKALHITLKKMPIMNRSHQKIRMVRKSKLQIFSV